MAAIGRPFLDLPTRHLGFPVSESTLQSARHWASLTQIVCIPFQSWRNGAAPADHKTPPPCLSLADTGVQEYFSLTDGRPCRSRYLLSSKVVSPDVALAFQMPPTQAPCAVHHASCIAIKLSRGSTVNMTPGASRWTVRLPPTYVLFTATAMPTC